MIQVQFYDNVDESKCKFAVMIARYQQQWVFCKHKDRSTLEVPGGRREANESIEETARRELYEETSAIEYTLQPICAYSVLSPTAFDGTETFGMLYYADIHKMEPELHYEIERIILTDKLPDDWTYPEIQPKLLIEAKRRGFLA